MAAVKPSKETGHSLLEVVVALALLSVLLLIAGRLLVVSRRVEASAAQVAAGPRLGALGVQLRRDVESAVGVPGSGGVWSSLSLQLHLKDGTAVQYDFDGERLLRKTAPPGGASRRRVIVRGLRSFRWRAVAGRAVDVKVSFPLQTLGERPSLRASGSQNAVWWIRAAPRGAGWSRQW